MVIVRRVREINDQFKQLAFKGFQREKRTSEIVHLESSSDVIEHQRVLLFTEISLRQKRTIETRHVEFFGDDQVIGNVWKNLGDERQSTLDFSTRPN